MSLVVVVYNIPREASRTLLSLSAAYQRHISAEEYEVIVVDNGSTPPLDPEVIDRLSGNFRLIRIDPAPPSPAHAINRGLAAARGEVIGVMIDGARIVTPGLMHFALHGARLFERSLVTTLGWHLGRDSSQRLAMDAGYDKAREDALLESIDWPNDGYRLFEIAALDPSSSSGWLTTMGESNALFFPRKTWEALGGADERFDAPGGGLLNHDIYDRALDLPGIELVVLLGEGTFHQVHGGIATNADVHSFAATFARWAEQYKTIRQRPWGGPREESRRTLLGTLPRAALAHFVRGALHPVRPVPRGMEPPLGHSFDGGLWSLNPITQPEDPVIAELVSLAQAEFRAGRYAAAAAVARLARSRAPDEAEPQRLLAYASQWLPTNDPPTEQRSATLLALAEAHRILGNSEVAAAEYREALVTDANLLGAHLGLAKLRMPGDDYEAWLARLHEVMRPEIYVEIGVATGATLALARPPTCAIGVGPEPTVKFPMQTETHVFTETSDDFFAAQTTAGMLAGRPVKLAFIDGLHIFEQSLRDFINLEPRCGPGSAIVFHGTVPLDEPTQRRERVTAFWTGDVWKTVLALKHYRSDLDIFTIATQPTGLTVVTNLDPASRVLVDLYDAAVSRFIDRPFSEVEQQLQPTLNIVPNDWGVVSARLRASGVL